MGPYLAKPNMTKNEEDGKNEHMSFGLCSMQGWRNTMED